MTVNYTLAVSSVSSHTWLKLMFRWKGSVWKSVLHELFLWLIGYYSVMFVYRSDLVLTIRQQEAFERIAEHMNDKVSRIPLTFMLGFFVTLVVDRWRNVFNNMGWIENAALTVSALIRGTDHETVLVRRSIVRYLVLTQVLVFRDISMKVRRRFPNMDSIVIAGFIHENELRMLEEIPIVYNKYWAPINWACHLCFKMRANNNITSEPALNNIVNVSHVNYVLNEIRNFRTNLALLCNFDWVPIPLAYPQVVFLAVRVYFFICLIARQFIVGRDAHNKSPIDMYVPLMTCLEFIFLVGWMKVAEALLNPLGEDDDDFECNYLIDKNIATGMAIVDDTFDKTPQLFMDSFKANYKPLYSEDSKNSGQDAPLVGSAQQVDLASKEEPVKMVEIVPNRSLIGRHDADPRRNSTLMFRKKLSDGLSFRKRLRSGSTASADGPSLPFSMSLPSAPLPYTHSRHTDRPFDHSFASGLTSDTVQEIDESPFIASDIRQFKPHHIQGHISEEKEGADEQTQTESEQKQETDEKTSRLESTTANESTASGLTSDTVQEIDESPFIASDIRQFKPHHIQGHISEEKEGADEQTQTESEQKQETDEKTSRLESTTANESTGTSEKTLSADKAPANANSANFNGIMHNKPNNDLINDTQLLGTESPHVTI